MANNNNQGSYTYRGRQNYNGNGNGNGNYGIVKEQILGQSQKTESTRVVCKELELDKGEQVLELRQWYTTRNDPNTLKASSTGIRIPDYMVPMVFHAAAQFMKARGIRFPDLDEPLEL